MTAYGTCMVQPIQSDAVLLQTAHSDAIVDADHVVDKSLWEAAL